MENGEACTNALSLSSTGVDTEKLMYLEEMTENFEERASTYSIGQLHRMLDTIGKIPANYSAWRMALAAGLACGAFTFLLGGGIWEMLFAFPGAASGQFVRKKLLQKKITLLANVGGGSCGCLLPQ